MTIEIKFHMTTPYDWLAKFFTNCYGHMTKMATMLIYGKNSLYISLEPKGHWLLDLVCSIGDVGPTRLEANYVSRLTLTYFKARSNLIPNAFIWGKS